MYKLFAVVFVCAVCMSSAQVNILDGNTAAIGVTSSGTETLDPLLIDYYGYQTGIPLLAPNLGPWTNLYAAVLPERSYIGQSNSMLIRGRYADQYIGGSCLGVLVLE